MAYLYEKPPLISPEKLKELSEIKTMRGLFLVLFNYVLIFITIFLIEKYFNWYLYLAALPIIASRIGALGVLMHDASHYRVVKNKSLNEVIGHLLLSWPLFFSVSDFRRNHSLHHRFTNTNDDPDWARKQINDQWIFPKSKISIIIMLLKDIVGIGIIDVIEDIKYTNATKQKNSRNKKKIEKFKPYFYILAISILFMTGNFLTFLMYWLIPGLTFGRMIIHLRTISDHMALRNYQHKYSASRTLIPNVIEEFFLCPHGISYHIEHHLYPNVPVYNLPKLHQELIKDDEFKRRAHITKGYLQLFDECSAGYVEHNDFTVNTSLI